MAAFDPSTYFVDPQVGKLIELNKGYFTIVDEIDYEKVTINKWAVTFCGTSTYASRRPVINGNRILVLMHRFILDAPDGLLVDHENNNGLDNRRRNIRICTHLENSRNRNGVAERLNYDYKYKGVRLRDGKDQRTLKFRAAIRYNGKQENLGTYDSEEDAAVAYDRAARKYYGEFAKTNFEQDDGRVLIKNSKKALDSDQIKIVEERLRSGENCNSIARDLGLSFPVIKRVKLGCKF